MKNEDEQEVTQQERIKRDSRSQRSSDSSFKTQVPPDVPWHRVVNVVSTASLGCRLDLGSIARRAKNVELHQWTTCVQLRIRSPRTTARISSRGHLMCFGAKSADDAHRACRRFARIIQRLGFPVRLSLFSIRNMMAQFRTFPVSLERLHVALEGNCSYEPEFFRGLFYKRKPVTACVFASGFVIFTGSAYLMDFMNVFLSLMPAFHIARMQSSSSLSLH